MSSQNNEHNINNDLVAEMSTNYLKERNPNLFMPQDNLEDNELFMPDKNLKGNESIDHSESLIANEQIADNSNSDIPWQDQEQERQIAVGNNGNGEVINSAPSPEVFSSINDLTSSPVQFDNFAQQRSEMADQLSLFMTTVPNKQIQSDKHGSKHGATVQANQTLAPVVINNSSNKRMTEPHCLEIGTESKPSQGQGYQTDRLDTKATGQLASSYQENDFEESEFDQTSFTIAEVDSETNSLANQLVKESMQNYLAAQSPSAAQDSSLDSLKPIEQPLSDTKVDQPEGLEAEDLTQNELNSVSNVASSPISNQDESWITKENSNQLDSPKTTPTIAIEISPDSLINNHASSSLSTANTPISTSLADNMTKPTNIDEAKGEDTESQTKESETNKENEAQRPLPPPNRGVLGLFVSKDGVANRRIATVVVVILIVGCMGWLGRSTYEGQSNQSSSDKARPLAAPQEEVRTIDSTDMSRSELGKVDRNEWNDKPLPMVTIPPMPPPVTPLPKPTAMVTPSPSPIPTPTPKLEPRSFAALLRAGEHADNVVPIPTNNPLEQVISLEGAQILLRMVEPFRSGIASIVKAEVLADVKDSKDNVIIPAHSIARIPFVSTAFSGRVINNVSNNTTFILPNGKKILLKGFVKGTDGLDGLAGKVTDKKGNIIARSMKSLGRVGARVIGLETGNYTGAIVESSIDQTIDSSVPYTPSGPIIEIKLGTRFTFNVLQ